MCIRDRSCSRFWWSCYGGSSQTFSDGGFTTTCSQCIHGPASCSGASCGGTCGGVGQSTDILLEYSDTLLAKIDAQCAIAATSMDGSTADCAQGFTDCARAVVSGALPQCDAGSSDASAQADSGVGVTTTFACYLASQNVCNEQKQVPQAQLPALQSTCAGQGGTPVTDGTGCPTPGLSGCCLQKGNVSETCYYNATAPQQMTDQNACTSGGGTWGGGLQ